jgi:hypothetical protein
MLPGPARTLLFGRVGSFGPITLAERMALAAGCECLVHFFTSISRLSSRQPRHFRAINGVDRTHYAALATGRDDVSLPPGPICIVDAAIAPLLVEVRNLLTSVDGLGAACGRARP